MSKLPSFLLILASSFVFLSFTKCSTQEAEQGPATPVTQDATNTSIIDKTLALAPSSPLQTNIPTIPPLSPNARLEDEQNTIDVFRAVAPATVFVTQTRKIRDLSMRALEVPAGSGSGFIWDKQGHIVTNYHVIDMGGQSGSYNVTLFNQKTYKAQFVGGEKFKDIAVLRIDAPPEELTPIQTLPEGTQLEVGQKTIAIGNPFGLDHTLTTGVISALGREVLGYGQVTIRDMIQTDASINPGNSGGPLLDSQGRLIAMNTMIFSQSGGSAGIGFAVPVSTIRRIVPQIVTTGRVERVGIGASLLQDETAVRVGVQGVIVGSVVKGAPADRAGLRGLRQTNDGNVLLGDVIVGVNNMNVRKYDDLYTAFDRYKAGDTVTLKVLRDGKIIEIPITLVSLTGISPSE